MSLDADISTSLNLFGKTVTDLQSSIAITEEKITGTLKYVADYTAAGFDMSKGHHFLVFHAESDTTGATLKSKVIPTQNPEATLDSDGIVIAQIAETSTGIQVTGTKGTAISTKLLALDVTLAEA